MDKESKNVVITDLNIPFWSMVFFMVKWSIATIPALLILSLIAWGVIFVASVVANITPNMLPAAITSLTTQVLGSVTGWLFFMGGITLAVFIFARNKAHNELTKKQKQVISAVVVLWGIAICFAIGYDLGYRVVL